MSDVTLSEEPRTISLGWMAIAQAVDDHLSKQEYEIEKLRAALRSIAANTCCDRCQEAALVARAALGEKK